MYLEFFALFKLISKMCFLGGVMKKIELQQRKVATSEKSVADKRSRLGQIETLINSLVFKKDLQSER